MFNRRTWIDTFVVDLTRMANEPMEAILANINVAYEAAVKTYDLSNAEKFVVSGKNKTPMGRKLSWSMVQRSPKSVTLKLYVSKRPVSIKDLFVRPNLSQDTTGANRQPVYVTCRKTVTIAVPKGFIWNGSIFMRLGEEYSEWRWSSRQREYKEKIINAKPFLIKSGADVSPALMLGEVKREVIDAAVEVFSGSIDGTGKNSK